MGWRQLDKRLEAVETAFRRRMKQSSLERALNALSPEDNTSITHMARDMQMDGRVLWSARDQLAFEHLMELVRAIWELTNQPGPPPTDADIRGEAIFVDIPETGDNYQRYLLAQRVEHLMRPARGADSIRNHAITLLAEEDQALIQSARQIGARTGQVTWSPELDAASNRYEELLNIVSRERTSQDWSSLDSSDERADHETVILIRPPSGRGESAFVE